MNKRAKCLVKAQRLSFEKLWREQGVSVSEPKTMSKFSTSGIVVRLGGPVASEAFAALCPTRFVIGLPLGESVLKDLQVVDYDSLCDIVMPNV